MYPNSDLELNYEDEHTISFFTGPFTPFDNFSAHTVTIWGKCFNTAEHAFQWKKFSETEPSIADAIFKAGSPWQVKKISRTSENRLQDWNKLKVQFMQEIIAAKVLQHEDVKNMLLATRGKRIIENSPTDSFWGVGLDGKGQNMMGKILMEIRDIYLLK